VGDWRGRPHGFYIKAFRQIVKVRPLVFQPGAFHFSDGRCCAARLHPTPSLNPCSEKLSISIGVILLAIWENLHFLYFAQTSYQQITRIMVISSLFVGVLAYRVAISKSAGDSPTPN
jgi:hypothetical protein